MINRLILAGLLCVISLGANAASIKISTGSGYQSTAEVHKAKGTPKGITVVMLHGKGGNPGVSHYSGFYSKLRKAGFTVIAPRMPYSRFDGNYTQTMEVINAAVDEAAKGGDRVVVAGHSMGAAISLHYGANHFRKEVVGIMPIALGHSPELSRKLMNITGPDVFKAREMVAAGKGDKKKSFADVNQGRRSSIRMTAATYLSYYDPQVFPGLGSVLPKIKVPVFWLSGADDRLTYVYDAENNFKSIPANPKSKYLEGKGDHKSVVYRETGRIIDWLSTL